MTIFPNKPFLISIVAFLLFFISSCAGRNLIKTGLIEDTEKITGTFTLILYGSAEYDGLEAIAFLDVEGDAYELEPHAPEFNYTVKKGYQFRNAALEAMHHVGRHHSFRTYQFRKILFKGGNTIGYEIRPLYLPFVYGTGDVLEVDYWLSANATVKIMIRLSSMIQNRFSLDNEDF